MAKIRGVRMAAMRTPRIFHVCLSVAATTAALTARTMVAGSAIPSPPFQAKQIFLFRLLFPGKPDRFFHRGFGYPELNRYHSCLRHGTAAYRNTQTAPVLLFVLRVLSFQFRFQSVDFS